jgi:hypothetical protein
VGTDAVVVHVTAGQVAKSLNMLRNLLVRLLLQLRNSTRRAGIDTIVTNDVPPR